MGERPRFIAEMMAFIEAGHTGATLSRDPVPGSVRVTDEDGAAVSGVSVSGCDVTIPAQGARSFVFYRPKLTMLVDSRSYAETGPGSVVWPDAPA